MDGERRTHVDDGSGTVRLHGLEQPPYHTTMMGVAKGALDYYGIARTPGEAFVSCSATTEMASCWRSPGARTVR